MKKRTLLFPHSHSNPENGCADEGAFSKLRATIGGLMPVVLAKGRQASIISIQRNERERRPITYQQPIFARQCFNKEPTAWFQDGVPRWRTRTTF